MKSIKPSRVRFHKTILIALAVLALQFALDLQSHSPLANQELMAQQDSSTAAKGAAKDTLTTKSGLKYIDKQVGKGKHAAQNSTVFVHYVGKLKGGKVFDKSNRRGRPFVFKLGAGEVIKGWDEGILGMKVGGKRTLIVPPELGYGKKQYGPIPANATLYFEVELIDVR